MLNVTYNCYQIFVHHFSYNVTSEKLMRREMTEPIMLCDSCHQHKS